MIHILGLVGGGGAGEKDDADAFDDGWKAWMSSDGCVRPSDTDGKKYGWLAGAKTETIAGSVSSRAL